MIDVLNILQLLRYVIMKLKAIQKKYKAIISYFLVKIIGVVQTFWREQKNGKDLKKIMKQFALNNLQVPHDEIKITHAYKSEYNRTR